MLKTVSITMLGGSSVQTDGRPILTEANKITKPWQLFCYLAVHRGEVVPAADLLHALWDDDDLTDPANVLKNAVYAIRKEIAGKAKPGDGPILYHGGGYCLNEQLQYDLDTERFEALCAAAQALPENDPGKTEACRAAVAAYTGDFLPMADNELWLAPFVRRFKMAYGEAAGALCACLEQQGRWDELLTVSTRASLAQPLDEACILYSFRAMAQLQMPRAIVATYGKTARFFEDELGQQLCPEIRRIYSAAAERVNKAEQDLTIIREDLQETLQESRPTKGPYYCTYDVFKRMFPILARNAERTKQTQVLMLLSLQDARHRVPSPQMLAQAMGDLRLAVNATMRRSDTYTRYSKHQYALLIPLENPDNAALVEKRLQSNYAGTPSAPRAPLQCRWIKL